jgi:hypothetical protein
MSKDSGLRAIDKLGRVGKNRFEQQNSVEDAVVAPNE